MEPQPWPAMFQVKARVKDAMPRMKGRTITAGTERV